MTRALAAGAALLACSALAAGPAAATDWQGYTYHPTTNVPEYQFLERIADNVEKATDGALKIKVVPAGTLPIKGNDVAQAVADDIIQFAGATSGTVALVPIYGLSRLPMLFPDEETLTRGLDEVLTEAIGEALWKKDVKLLAMWWYPAHSIWTVGRKIEKLEDIDGLKLRVTSPQQGDLIKQYGAIPVTIATAEVAPALQQGVVDGVLTSTAGARLWIDMLKFNYKIALNYGTSLVLANRQAFEALPEDVQQKLVEASKEGAHWVTTTLGSEEEDRRKQFVDEGKITLTVSDKAERAKALEKARSVWEANARQVGPEGEAALEKLKEIAGK